MVRRRTRKSKTRKVLQFYIELLEIEPTIWRRIQVPSDYSFWALHVAIQDSMGWSDSHLHAFRVSMPHKKKKVEIGIPDEDFDFAEVLPGWKIRIMDYFIEPGKEIPYDYDFGDGWEHRVLLEAIMIPEEGVSYPRCIGGERACPPEDCGGIPGYYELVEVLKDPKHPEYRGLVNWLKGHSGIHYPYKPEKFDPRDVEFWDPEERLDMAFS